MDVVGRKGDRVTTGPAISGLLLEHSPQDYDYITQAFRRARVKSGQSS